MAKLFVASKQTPLEELPLPSDARSLNGVVFDARPNIWKFREAAASASFNFHSLPASDALTHSVKLVVLEYVRNHSIRTALRVLDCIRHFLRAESKRTGAPVAEISGASILRYRSSFPQRRETHLEVVSAALKQWYRLRLPGLAEDVYQILRELRFPFRSNGQSVRTMDPDDGPFSNVEAALLQKALEDAYSSGDITLHDYVLAALVALLGARPIQYALLKVCDISVTKSTNDPKYLIRLPRAKQRGGSIREQHSTRLIVASVGRRLVQHVDEVKQKFTSILDDPTQAPLFPLTKRGNTDPPQGFTYHRTAASVGISCKRIYRSFGVISERTRAPLRVTPQRFRRTVGTRAAEAGHSPFVIAFLLDHSGIDSIMHYVEATHTIRDRIDRALAMKTAPLAGAFMGTVISDESEATLDGQPMADIDDPNFGEGGPPIGRCAHHGPCDLLAPMECFTCPSFRPWKHGPHERVLDYLLQERERQYSEHSPVKAAANDITIYAVARVVQLCKASTGNSKRKTDD